LLEAFFQEFNLGSIRIATTGSANTLAAKKAARE